MRKAPRGEVDRDERLEKSSTCEMGIQVSCGYFAEISEKGALRKSSAKVGEIMRERCRQKGVELEEGRAMPDLVHILPTVSPKYSIAVTIGYLKGRSAIRLQREVFKTREILFGRTLWAQGYFTIQGAFLIPPVQPVAFIRGLDKEVCSRALVIT